MVTAVKTDASTSTDKFYIMAMAATGKSTFARSHEGYLGYHIVDFAEELPPQTLTTRFLLLLSRFIPPIRRAIKDRPDVQARFRQNYFNLAFDYIDNFDGPLVLLGRRTRSNYADIAHHDRVKFAMVLIDEDQHRAQVDNRKRTMKSFLPFMHHWTTDWDKIRRLRAEMRAYAESFDIPIYESFELAIDAMHQQHGSDRDPL